MEPMKRLSLFIMLLLVVDDLLTKRSPHQEFKIKTTERLEKVFLKKDMDVCELSPHQEFKIKTTERS